MPRLPLIAWSHSAVNLFKQCPHRFYESRITKRWKEEFKGPAAEWGLAVHKAMERRIKYGATLPANMVQYEPLAAKLEAMPGTKHCELQLAINKLFERTEWFAKDTWARCALDFMCLSPSETTAFVLDYKTGKRKEDDSQLALQAGFTFTLYPKVQKVISGFYWMGEGGGFEKSTFTREFSDRLWRSHLPYVDMMEESVRHGEWPKKPSGLCKGWCPVETCKFWQPKKES